MNGTAADHAAITSELLEDYLRHAYSHMHIPYVHLLSHQQNLCFLACIHARLWKAPACYQLTAEIQYFDDHFEQMCLASHHSNMHHKHR